MRSSAGTAATTHVRAVALALTGYTCWVLGDASLKRAGSSTLPGYELLGLIGAGEVVLLLCFALIRGTPSILWPRRPSLQVVRSALDLINNLFVVVALRHLPLALFYVLVFLAPLLTSLLAALLLREFPGWKQGAALAVGFLGVLVAVDPRHLSRPEGWTGYIACLLCVLCFSVNMVWSRRLTQTEHPASMVFMSGLMMVAGGVVGSMFFASRPPVQIVGILAATSALMVVGSTCFFLALRYTTAATVSQFHYSQLVTGAVVAYLGWHEKPTAFLAAGAILILVSGAYAARLRPKAVREATSQVN